MLPLFHKTVDGKRRQPINRRIPALGFISCGPLASFDMEMTMQRVVALSNFYGAPNEGISFRCVCNLLLAYSCVQILGL